MDDEFDWNGTDFRLMPENLQNRRRDAAKIRARALRHAAIADFFARVGRAVALPLQ